MMRIALCDDETKQLEQIADLLEEYKSTTGAEAEICCFGHPDALLEAAARSDFDLYLLDIVMPMLSGIELAREIRQTDSQVPIVFLTTSKEYALDAFGVSAMQYLVKPVEKAGLFGVLDRVFTDQRGRARHYLPLHTEAGLMRVQLSAILYCESKKNYQFIHTDSGILKVRMTATGLYQLLAGDTAFVRMGASYILNLDKIREVTPHEVKLSDGQSLQIPRGAHPELRARFFEYYRGR